MRLRFALALVLIAGAVTLRVGAGFQPIPEQTAKDKRLEWFRAAKYSLFIHWGLSAIPTVDPPNP